MAGDDGRGGDQTDGVTGPVETHLPGELVDRVQEFARELLGAHAGMKWWRAHPDDLTTALEQLDELRRAVDVLRTAVSREVADRGLHVDGGFSLSDYLAARSPWVPQKEVTALARTANRLRERKNAAIAHAVQSGELSVARADVLLTALRRIAPYVDADTYRSHAELLLPLAQLGQDKELRTATEHLVALATPELSAEELAKAREESCKVFESSLSGGMRRFIIEADPEGAAMLDSVFASVLTKPTPGPQGEPDKRSAGKRRYDALMTVLGRGMSHPEGVPTTSKVSILLAVDYDVLADRVGRNGRSSGGPGDSFFTAGQMRRMACGASLIPAVLGGPSQVLDHGRTRRLASPAQLRVLYTRDKCCTFPGCSMPARWTEAHHADVWWSEGGLTDVLRMALLCRRHHIWVHAWDPEVTITRWGVNWHLDRLHGNGRARARLHSDGSCREPGDSGGDPATDEVLPLDPEAMPEPDDDGAVTGWAEAMGACPGPSEQSVTRTGPVDRSSGRQEVTRDVRDAHGTTLHVNVPNHDRSGTPAPRRPGHHDTPRRSGHDAARRPATDAATRRDDRGRDHGTQPRPHRSAPANRVSKSGAKRAAQPGSADGGRVPP